MKRKIVAENLDAAAESAVEAEAEAKSDPETHDDTRYNTIHLFSIEQFATQVSSSCPVLTRRPIDLSMHKT